MSQATLRISHLEAILHNSEVSTLAKAINDNIQLPENKPSAGIINPNNLCFLNTVMQIITHCNPLAESILRTASKEDSEFFQAIASACEIIRLSKETLPAEFILDIYETVRKSIQLQGQPIQNFQQEDACDLLLAIFTHDLVSKNGSPFSSIMATEFKEISNEKVVPFDSTASLFSHTTTQPVTLNITSENKDLEFNELLQSFLTDERSDCKSLFHEDGQLITKTYTTKIYRSLDIQTIPELLFIKNNLKVKANLPFEIDQLFHGERFLFSAAIIHQGLVKESKKVTDLYSQKTGGHYFALVKKGDNFYTLNDERVKTISRIEAKKLIQTAPLVLYSHER